MSRLRTPRPVKAIIAFFSADRRRLDEAAVRLEDILSPIDYLSEPIPFDQTDYYTPEMGAPLVKRFLAAENLIDPMELVRIKIQAARLEEMMAVDGRRTVNLDPGYVSAGQLVLATGKTAAHRLYLGSGVWAELTLIYRSGSFNPLPWTYPDYASEGVRAIMKDIRSRYLYQLKSGPREER
ncbi:MAG: DUF4416 family protein [Thermodesulfobacteriota bacterium]